jgi:large subunit ribosomal protein L5
MNPFSSMEKIVVNSGIGKLTSMPNFKDKVLPAITAEFAAIVGQKPSPRGAKKSIAGFKLREGTVVGLVATIRGARMRSFFERMNKVVFPRVRDFRGIPRKNIDLQGNLTIGIKEHTIFPEISPEHSKVSFGIQMTIVPKKPMLKEEAIAWYQSLGVPLTKN